MVNNFTGEAVNKTAQHRSAAALPETPFTKLIQDIQSLHSFGKERGVKPFALLSVFLDSSQFFLTVMSKKILKCYLIINVQCLKQVKKNFLT